MTPKYNADERELIKLIHFFKKQADKLVKEGKLDEDQNQVKDACEKLLVRLEEHVINREEVTEQREKLKTIVQDNAQCPQCNQNSHLKFISVDTHAKGWKCNRYRCRRCNIEFTWNRPNNPWDMIVFMENLIEDIKGMLLSQNESYTLEKESVEMMAQLEQTLSKIKPAVETVDKAFNEMKARDKEMSKLIHDFKNYLLIEKVKMNSWNPQTGEA